MSAAAKKFLLAVQEAGKIYRHVAEKKGTGNFVTEVSVDETDSPQTPVELFFILAMIAQEKIPVADDRAEIHRPLQQRRRLRRRPRAVREGVRRRPGVIAFAIKEFGLPATLKLSVHSGSDKFSLYPIINRLIKKHDAGLHVKTAGTTWLEEVIGLAEAGGEGLAIAKEIYAEALAHFDELTGPTRP